MRCSPSRTDTRTEAVAGDVPPTKANWLLKIIDIFGLSGVKFVLRNLKPGTHSAGLGGSATATTGVCILANELAGRPLGPRQLTSLASRMEHDLGVSITGTQEQSNVVFGGVTDYVWFPWGIPGQAGGGYGDCCDSRWSDPNILAKSRAALPFFTLGDFARALT